MRSNLTKAYPTRLVGASLAFEKKQRAFRGHVAVVN
jgi:hypothetical protein